MIWIRSQDKNRLTKVHNKFGIDKYWMTYDSMGCLVDAWHVEVDGSSVGTYSSKEKALKVLDMIQKVVIDNGYMEVGTPKMFSPQHCVFEMPKDDEIDKMMEYLEVKV